jgi:hypothetical protein
MVLFAFLLLFLASTSSNGEARVQYKDDGTPYFTLEVQDMQDCVNAQDEAEIYKGKYEETLLRIPVLEDERDKAKKDLKFYQDLAVVEGVAAVVLALVTFFFGWGVPR